jgi:hypothetical protein
MPVHDWSRVDAGIFHDLHLGWIDGLRAVLNRGLLPEPFYALAEPVLGSAVPDVLTPRGGDPVAPQRGVPGGMHDDAAVRPVIATLPMVVLDPPPVEAYSVLARQIVIRSSLRDDEVIAVIELVSRANKMSREERDRFVSKSVELLRRGIHLVVVDVQPPTALVPAGFHALVCEAHGESPAKLPENRPLQAISYQVLEDSTTRSHVVAMRVGDVLPEMPVFLTAHQYVRVPLEETYTTAFGNLPRRFRAVLEAHTS